MSSYYDTNKRTTANSKEFILEEPAAQHFPSEGLYLGTLNGGAVELPALVDLTEIKGLCFLHSNSVQSEMVNRCLERMAWRLALTVPSNLCDIVLYNGGNPGENYTSHSRMNRYITGERSEQVFFDGNNESFDYLISEIYGSIPSRMAAISCAGKQNLYELNESLGRDARLKYTFIILTSFPHHLKHSTLLKLSQMVESGTKAGIHVLMSWDMNADFDDALKDQSFNPQQMLEKMELLYPNGESYFFKNSGHDDILNRFCLSLDDQPISPLEAEKWASHLNRLVDVARKNNRPVALKQDFESLEKAPYEPIMSEINVTVGLDVNDKHPVTIRFNSGDYIHAFILGQSGSGKSVLLNNIISSAILKYSPDDLMLYLLDFKGVEFNRYKGLKHTKAVLVDNTDPQMTLEVLRELRDENRRRIKLWQSSGVNNIDGYNRKNTTNRIPQILFVADECQVMFKESTTGTDRMIQMEIAEILNTIATQGRSQGIHMLLATQQLDETDISGQILKNLTECFLLMSAPSDSEKLVPDSSDMTSRQLTGIACYYHKKTFQSQVQTYFAKNEELESVIASAQQKASTYAGNGAHYFCGSSMYYLAGHKEEINPSGTGCPVALIGQNIGINAGTTLISLQKDFYEHILFWGANKQEQATGTLINAFISLILSYQAKGDITNFYVIDCLPGTNYRYKRILAELENRGLCRLIERQESGELLHRLVDDIKNDFALPTVVAIIGSERFIEMKRNMSLTHENISESSDEDISFDMGALGDLMETGTDTENMTYQQALMYLLEEGGLHDVHILLQVDKPNNILFSDEYDVEAASKFRHKVILRSENKLLYPFRFSQEIDVERLSDEEEHLRAYYYPDGEDPVLFTPYQMPEDDILE